MAKSKKIELPQNTDFKSLVAASITSSLADPVGNGLNKQQEEALAKITPFEVKILANAIEIAAKDGLYENEVEEILGDLNDLIHHASKKASFNKLITNPADPKFELSAPMIEVIKSLKPIEQVELFNDIHSQGPDLGARLLAFFSKIAENLEPIFKIVAVHLIKIGSDALGKFITEKVDNSVGDVLKLGLHDVSDSVSSTILPKEETAHEVPVAGAVDHAHT